MTTIPSLLIRWIPSCPAPTREGSRLKLRRQRVRPAPDGDASASTSPCPRCPRPKVCPALSTRASRSDDQVAPRRCPNCSLPGQPGGSVGLDVTLPAWLGGLTLGTLASWLPLDQCPCGSLLARLVAQRPCGFVLERVGAHARCQQGRRKGIQVQSTLGPRVH